ECARRSTAPTQPGYHAARARFRLRDVRRDSVGRHAAHVAPLLRNDRSGGTAQGQSEKERPAAHQLPTVKRRTVPKVPGGSASQDSRIRTRSWTVALPLPVRRRCCVLVIGRQLPSISSTWRSVSGLLTPCELPRFGVSALTQSDQDKGRIQSELVMFTVTTEP